MKTTMCEFCKRNEGESDRVKCGSCKKRYRGVYCSDCKVKVEEQTYCAADKDDPKYFYLTLAT